MAGASQDDSAICFYFLIYAEEEICLELFR
jgi:hypothetical protein